MVSQYNLGLLHGQRGDPAQAAAMIAAAVTSGEHLHGPNHPALLILLEGQASALVELGRWREASAICQRGRALAARLKGVGPTLLPLLELQAMIAGNRRSPAAETMAAEVVALAEAESGADSQRAKYTALRSWPYSEAREPGLAAARAAVKASSLPLWADTAVFRIDAMHDAGRSPRTLIDEVRADEAWASVSPRLRITIGLFAARAALDEGRAEDAARELDEVEALGREEPPFAMQMQVDHIRGELAARAGDPRAAVELLRRAAAGCATFDEDHPRRLIVRAALARALRASGATAEAEEVARDVIRLYRSLGAGFEPEASALEAWLGAAPAR